MNIVTNKFTKDWIRDQVHFRYGHYCWVNDQTWVDIGAKLTIDDVVTTDETLDSIKLKNFPKTKDHRYLMYLDKVKLWQSFRDFSDEYIFPFRFVDNGGHKQPAIGCNRLVHQGLGMLCIVDDMYERYSYGGYHAKPDAIPFEEKNNKVHFLGSFTGPTQSRTDGPWWGIYKTCRIEVVSKWLNAGDWIDVGLIDKAMPESVRIRQDFEEKIKPLIKPKIQFEENFKNKYILCVEGNDVSSSFSWAIASHCLPIHTYPYTSESLYGNGLRPYEHFVPVKKDTSDLEETYKWCEDNQDICKKIVNNGREHMKLMQDKELNLVVEKEFVAKWGLKKKHLKVK
jgi:hypothetical protein